MVAPQPSDSSTVHLWQIKEVLRWYCQGLTAKNVQISSAKELTDKGIGWISVEEPATEGSSIFLPPTICEFTTEDHNFAHYKVLATHQAAHLEFGTFDFSFAKDSSLFSDARTAIQDNSGANGASLTDFQRFFDLFPDRKLASDIFMIVEDTRVDYLLKQEYRGIRGAYERAQQSALGKRPEITSLPAREALLEILVQLSIENWGFFPVPRGLSQKLANAVATLRRVRSRRATVEDSAEATIRIFNLLHDTENTDLKPRSPEEWDSSNPLDNSFPGMEEDDLQNLLSEFMNQNDGSGRPNNRSGNAKAEQPYSSPRDVDFRGGIKPELVQTLRLLRREIPNNTSAPSAEDLQQLFENSVEIDAKDSPGDNSSAPSSLMQNLLKERGKMSTPPKRPDQKPLFHVMVPSDANSPSASRDGPAFLYDEWDYVADSYRRRWCRLRQRIVEEGVPEFYADVLKSYSGLVANVRREFERLRTERFKKVRRLQDGDEFDFDSVIEAVVEKKVGVTPGDKLYWRKNKVERDVCVTFLLDMSASTYESVSGGYRLSPTVNSSEHGAERAKRIIDVEKESIVVLVEALEAIGDTYGIYGFSGHGKDNVEFYVIKDITEDMTLKAKKRIDKIAPAQETRMGTAIRHATFLLDKQEYKTKILLLLSDGRPQDHDYGAHHFRDTNGPGTAMGSNPFASTDHSYDRLMKEYAVNDTRMALLEAKQRGIVPFCLTVDRRGHDYLKAMCGDIGYEVIDDITSLPKRLPSLYRRLTT